MSDEITLPDAARRIYEMFGERAPTYRMLCDRALSGRVPAYRGRNRTWMIRSSELERVLVQFGLPVRRAALARPSGGRAA